MAYQEVRPIGNVLLEPWNDKAESYLDGDFLVGNKYVLARYVSVHPLLKAIYWYISSTSHYLIIFFHVFGLGQTWSIFVLMLLLICTVKVVIDVISTALHYGLPVRNQRDI